MAFTIIAALDEARGIGKDGKLSWNLKGDLQHYKKTTVGDFDSGKVNAIIMGRTTWNSLPDSVRPMPKRLNIILTRDPAFVVPPDAFVAKSLDDALKLAAEYGSGEIFVIGGAQVYAEAIAHPECTRLLLTHVERRHDCDAFFPMIPESFKEVKRSEPVEEAGERYRFVTYERA